MTSRPKWFAAFQRRLADPRDGPVIGLEDKKEEALMLFFRRSRARHSDHTLKNRKVAAKQFLEYCDTRGIDPFEVDTLLIEDWMDMMLDADYAPRTVRAKIYCISAMYKRWEKRGFVDENPVEDAEDVEDLTQTRISEHADTEYLEPEEYETLLNACNTTRETLTLKLLWDTGVRVQEAVSIKIKDINRKARSITVTTAKSGRHEDTDERTVYYSRSLERTLRTWLDRGERNSSLGVETHTDGEGDDSKNEGYLLVTNEAPEMATGRVTKIVREVVSRTPLQETLYVDKSGRPRERITPHLFRKSYGVHRTKNGMPIAYLTVLMGHNDIETTRDHYLKFREDDIQDAERRYAP